MPYAGRAECGECYKACAEAGHNAIELQSIVSGMDEAGAPIGDAWPAPVVLAEKCVGCGLCRARCHGVNVREKRLLAEPAIGVIADGADRASTVHIWPCARPSGRRRAQALRARRRRRFAGLSSRLPEVAQKGRGALLCVTNAPRRTSRHVRLR